PAQQVYHTSGRLGTIANANLHLAAHPGGYRVVVGVKNEPAMLVCQVADDVALFFVGLDATSDLFPIDVNLDLANQATLQGLIDGQPHVRPPARPPSR